jgi:hypothetical protein
MEESEPIQIPMVNLDTEALLPLEVPSKRTVAQPSADVESGLSLDKPKKIVFQWKSTMCFILMILVAFPIFVFLRKNEDTQLEDVFEQIIIQRKVKNDTEVYGELSGEPSNGRYAVCISGNEGERLLDTLFWTNLKNNVLTNDTDLFIYLETTLQVGHSSEENVYDISALKRLYAPWLRSFIITNKNLDKEMEFYSKLGVKPEGATRGYDGSIRRFIKLSKCYSLLQSYEFFKGVNYEMIVQMRPNLLFPYPINFSVLDDQEAVYTLQAGPTAEPREDGLLEWPGEGVGLTDFGFIGSSMVSRIIAQSLFLELAGLENYQHGHSFPEMILKYILVDRLHLKTRPTAAKDPLWASIPKGWKIMGLDPAEFASRAPTNAQI